MVTFLTPLATNFDKARGPLGHCFQSCNHTENPSKMSFSPYGLHEISVLIELILGHLCYHLTDVPPQPNSPPDNVFGEGRPCKQGLVSKRNSINATFPNNQVSKTTSRVVVFHRRLKSSHLCYTSQVILQCQTRVKLNRVFLPRCEIQARSLGCGFTQ